MMKGVVFMQTADTTAKITGESPFKPEYDEYLSQYPGRGALKVQISVARDAFPVEGVFVDVASVFNGKRYTLYHDVTDSSGIVNEIVLPTLPASSSLDPQTAGQGEAEYLVSAFHPAFGEITDCPVKVLDRIETILPITLTPSTKNGEAK